MWADQAENIPRPIDTPQSEIDNADEARDLIKQQDREHLERVEAHCGRLGVRVCELIEVETTLKNKNSALQIRIRELEGMVEAAAIPTAERWRAKDGERYWFKGRDGVVLRTVERHDTVDDGRWEEGNYFETKDDVEATDKSE